MFSSIRARLIITYVVIVLLVMFLVNVFLLNLLENYHLGYQKDVLSQAGRLVADFSHDALLEDPDFVALSSLAEDFSRQIGARVMIVNHNNVVVGDSVRVEGLIGSLLEREEITQAFEEGEGYSIQRSSQTNQWVMQVAVPVYEGGNPRGAVFISYSLSSIYEMLEDIRNILIYTTLMALVLVGSLGSVFAQKITRPIKALTQVIRETAEGNLDQNIKVINNDEMGQLAVQFNTMMARLREMTRRLQDTIQEVSTERNKLTAILTNMIDGVIAVDADGKLILANPVAENIFNFEAEKNMGKSLKEINIDYQLDRYFIKVWKDKRETSGELTWSDQVFKVTVAPVLGQDKELYGSVAVLQDITSMRKLEQKQREFIADVSHELRTPLSSVNLLVKNMLDYDLVKEEGEEFLRDIDAEIERLNLLVQDILDLTRMESLKGRVNQKKTDLKKVFDDTLVRMSPRAERNQLELTWDIPEFPPLLVNEDQIKQVLINLVDNAIKYTPEGGWLKVEGEDQGEEILIKVKDTGPGIPEEDQDRIFERFYRVDKTRSREMGGTGLGLAICREIITAHGGGIWLESKEGYGTSFLFTLPKKSNEKGYTKTAE